MTILSQQGHYKRYDALVIGSGIAGLSYVLALLQAKPALKIALVSKTQLSESNSAYAQGGIAAVSSRNDTLSDHIKDTLSAGAHHNVTSMVQKIISQGPNAIAFLQNQGVQFDESSEGTPHLHAEGGHSTRRIYHVHDQTGKAIIGALLKSVLGSEQVDCLEEHVAVNLITRNEQCQPGLYPEVIGAYILDQKRQLIDTVLANVVVLATGGAGKVYRYTSNAPVVTGDGIAMAARAGARIVDMEFYQFHPTLFYHPKANHFLISEALRGEGAYLRTPQTGERFMKAYEPRKMEMSTRDVVARAVFSEIEKNNSDYVHLDVRHLDHEFLESHFPHITSRLSRHGYDLKSDLIPVVPAAHYCGGGILSNEFGETDLPGLYAIGETAATGFHGANRLASNSLLEAVVMAQNAAKHSVKHLDKPLPDSRCAALWNSKGVIDLRRASQISAQWRGLRGEMTSYAGIIRTREGLKDCLRLIRTRRDIIQTYYWQHHITRDLVELRNICLVAELIVKAALLRRESCGGHYREDQDQCSQDESDKEEFA